MPPPIQDLPDYYRVCQREDGSWWQLGRGDVYKATDLRANETVALRFFDAGPRSHAAMGTLAEYAARLARPGLPLVSPLRDFFVTGNFTVAATEFIPGESLAERVRRTGPLDAATAWGMALCLLDALASLHALGIAHGSLEPSKILFPGDAGDARPLVLVEAGLHPAASVAADPAAGSVSTRDDLGRLGATLWFALTGDDFDPSPAHPLPWPRLEGAQITADLGALPVLLARTLTGEPAQRPPTAPALLAALNLLESLRSPAPVWPEMPSGASSPPPVAPPPEPRLPVTASGESWTRTTTPLSSPNRRRRSRQIWLPLALLAIGGGAGFFLGVTYERTRPMEAVSVEPFPVPKPAPVAASTPAALPDPGIPLPPSPPVSRRGVSARLERIKSLQPDVGDILKYARELRRVATLPVADGSPFPTDAQVTRLLERFDWRDPASPNFHRTPLLLVLGYAGAPPVATAQQSADEVAQALAHGGITSPIYTCGLDSGADTPEIEPMAARGGQFVEVWVAFTLF